jgi:RNA polymerase sigma-70 factor (ECF subfamily)
VNNLQIESLVKKHENRIYRTAIAILNNKADAEDIMQDVFLKIIEKQPVFDTDEHEEAWIVRVTVNKCKSLLRTAWFKKSEPLLDIYPADDPESHNLVESINKLPSKYRIVIYLFYYEGYSTKEIAEITKSKDATVRSHLNRARTMLKGIITNEEIHQLP